MENLPTEIIEEIFKKMSFEDIKNCEKVCRRWRTIIRNRTSRARRELESLIEGIAYLALCDEEELKRRKLRLKAWALKWGYRGKRKLPQVTALFRATKTALFRATNQLIKDMILYFA